jgi:chromosome segregation ATPase
MAGKKKLQSGSPGAKITEDGVLGDEMRSLMTPKAVDELKGLSPTMQQFLLRWQDKRDLILGEQLKEDLKIFLLDVYKDDNKKLCETVTRSVSKELAEVLVPMIEKLNELATSIKQAADDISVIKGDIKLINSNVKLIEDRIKLDEEKILMVEKRLEDKKRMLEDLRKDVNKLEPTLIAKLITEVNELRPAIDKMIRTQTWWNISLRIAIAVGISMAMVAIFLI